MGAGAAADHVELVARFPAGPAVSVDSLLAEVSVSPPGGPLRVGDQRIVDFLSGFARSLLRPARARRFPELASLGFFLRRGEIAKVISRMQHAPAGATPVPRGLILHLPPANVDTIFVYSWALAALAGNHNIVRVSPRSAAAASAVLETLNDCLADADPAVAQTQRMVTYGHEDAVSERLSLACDLRVIWGGDEAVSAIRRFPLQAGARDLTFPDRSSFAALSVPGWQGASPAQRRAAAEGFVNDTYWFDQAACSSPRTVFLVGGEPSDAAAVRVQLLDLVGGIVRRRGWGVDAAMAVQQRVAGYGLAADGDATRVDFDRNLWMGLDLTGPEVTPRRWLAAASIPFATIGSLDELVPLVRRRDQTLSYFGFDRAELTEFVTALAGRGLDRIVPFGSALSFAAVWDGYDLPAEFCRLVTVS